MPSWLRSRPGRATERSVEPLRARLEQMGSWIEELSQRAAPARSRWKMLLAGRDGRETARAALAELDEQVHAHYAIELAEGAQRALTAQPPDRVDVWDRYARDAVRLNGLLVDVGGLGPDEDLVHGRLPARDRRASQRAPARHRAARCVTTRLSGVRREVRAGTAPRDPRRRDGSGQDDRGTGRDVPPGRGGRDALPGRLPGERARQLDHEVERHTQLCRPFGSTAAGRDRRRRAGFGSGEAASPSRRSRRSQSFVAARRDVSIAMLVVDEAHYVKNPGTRSAPRRSEVGRPSERARST